MDASGAAALVRPDEGRINRRIFGDPDIYALELECRTSAEGWRLAGREVLFAADVLPTKSLSLFY